MRESYDIMAAFKLRLTLEDSGPVVTRTFLIPSEASFNDLICTINILLGWSESVEGYVIAGDSKIGDAYYDPDGTLLDKDYEPLSEYEGRTMSYVCELDGCPDISLEWLGVEPGYDRPWPEIIGGSGDAPREDLDIFYDILDEPDLPNTEARGTEDVLETTEFDMEGIASDLKMWPVQGIRPEGSTSLNILSRLVIMKALQAAIDHPLVFDRLAMSPRVVKRTVKRKSKRRGSDKMEAEMDAPSVSPEEIEADPSRFVPLAGPISSRSVNLMNGFAERHPEVPWPEYDAENPKIYGPIIMDNGLDDEFFDYMTEFCTREMLEWARRSGFYFKNDDESLASFIDMMIQKSPKDP